MITVAQLDPASLSLWYDPGLIAQHPGRESISEVVWLAMTGRNDELRDFVGTIRDEKLKVRCIHLASAIWHEQRHFLDLLLTNHGAFLVRQFFSLYVNMATLLSEAQKSDKAIYCPIDLYADPVRCEVLGVDPPSEQLLIQAKNLRGRKEMAEYDRQPVLSPFGFMEVGGDAQLEGLAWIYQHSALQDQFGLEMTQEVQDDLPDAQRSNLRYKWLFRLNSGLDLVPVEEKGKDAQIVDATLLCAILFGSLATRRWGQKQDVSEFAASGFAAERLAGFLRALKGRKLKLSVLKPLEAWEEVNSIAKKLWGRTVLEEMEQDYLQEKIFCQKIRKFPDAVDAVKDALEDLHALRGSLLKILQDAPLAVLDTSKFWELLLPKLRPFPIIASSSGLLGEVPEDLETVIGFDDPTTKLPESKWSWATTPRDWPSNDGPLVVLQERQAWLQIIRYFGPLAKLMMNGNRHRVMLGPELVYIERHLESKGFTILFDPLFAFPEEVDTIQFFWALTGRSAAVCDTCRTTFAPPNGHVISPWRFRHNQEIAETAIRAFGGGKKGELHFWRDWSEWVVCDACFQNIFRGS